MPDVTATDAARRFSDLLDSVEHRGEQYTITRHGKAIARIEPASSGRGGVAKDLLRRHRPDPQLARELASVRELLEAQDRS